MDLREIAGIYGLERCIGCRSCTKNCPSARHGGIVPDETIKSVREGTYDGDPWKCLQCHRCSAACPKKIDVASVIIRLRRIQTEAGNVPERFRRVGKVYSETGGTMNVSPSADRNRGILGLEPLCGRTDIPKKAAKMGGRESP
ncbi:MAG: 4Fe-4S dicluster domain-containing protein [Candidatus Methanomethylophilaceae archaeon]